MLIPIAIKSKLLYVLELFSGCRNVRLIVNENPGPFLTLSGQSVTTRLDYSPSEKYPSLHHAFGMTMSCRLKSAHFLFLRHHRHSSSIICIRLLHLSSLVISTQY